MSLARFTGLEVAAVVFTAMCPACDVAHDWFQPAKWPSVPEPQCAAEVLDGEAE